MDTGSRDRITVQIAESMAPRFINTWSDDFPAAKNYAISKARGSGLHSWTRTRHLLRETGKASGDFKTAGIYQGRGDSGWMDAAWMKRAGSAPQEPRSASSATGLIWATGGGFMNSLDGWTEPPCILLTPQGLSILHSGYRGAAWEEKKGKWKEPEPDP